MSGFEWNSVIEAIAGIVDPDLVSRGITLHAIQPNIAQDCRTPMLFPSRNPTIHVNSVKRITFGQATNGGRRHKGEATYTLDWMYLHVEYAQKLNTFEYEVAIRQNLAAIFRAIVRRDRSLGIGRVQPSSAEIDYNLLDPTSGKMFLGAHVVLTCEEIFEL